MTASSHVLDYAHHLRGRLLDLPACHLDALVRELYPHRMTADDLQALEQERFTDNEELP